MSEIEKLKAEIFNLECHYDILKQSYDTAFDFFAEQLKITPEQVFEKYKAWLVEKED